MTPHRTLAAVLAATALAAVSCSTTPTASMGSHSVHADSQTTADTAASAARPTATAPADPGGTPAGPLPRPSDIDDADPDQVAIAAVIALYTVDSRTDASPTDAYRRAAPWLTAELAADLAAVPPAGGADWLNIAAHRGYTTVTSPTIANEYGQPPDADRVAYRAVTFTVTTINRDEANSSTTARDTRYLRLAKAGGAWKVSGLIS